MVTGKLTFVDVLLNWTPAVALVVGVIVYFSHRHALPDALPILILWAISKPVSVLAEPSAASAAPEHHGAGPAFPAPRCAAHLALLREFSNAEHNWLIPDNVQEEPAAIAARAFAHESRISVQRAAGRL